MCNEVLIQNVMKFGHAWVGSKEIVKATDKRIKSGRYLTASE